MAVVVVEIGHAGHVHFFRPVREMLLENDIELVIYSRNKPGCFELLRHYGINSYIDRTLDSNTSKLISLLPRSLSVLQLAKSLDAKALVGIHPVHSALASRVSNFPSIAFADTDYALEQIMLYGIFSDHLITPRSYRWRFGKKHITYSGFQELSYLHPNHFEPKREKLDEAGLLDNGPPVIVRLISWDATHDLGVRHTKWERKLIQRLSKDHRVIVSSEGQVPRDLKRYENPLPAHEFHNLLAFSRLYIGAGATSSSEAAMLGVPAVYTNPLRIGYLEELEQRYQLIRMELRLPRIDIAVSEALETPLSIYQKRRKKMLSNTCDVAAFASNQISRLISHFPTMDA